ncbi:MAG: polysaccharide biosynthesis tyrosine autokinase [Candidatus Electrothrix sp. AW3_4]|nr:polysaccharide biosynthesis tyrosine autokinase [Candidatus Electrothrix gigas]
MSIPPHHNRTKAQQNNNAVLRKYLHTLLQRKETKIPISLINTVPGLSNNQQHAEKELRHYLLKLLDRKDTPLPIILINPTEQKQWRDGNTYSLRTRIQILLHWKWLILFCTLVIPLFIFLFSKEQTPLYRASSQVLLQINLPADNRLLKKNPRYNRQFFLPTQIELLKSFNVASRITENLNLAQQYKDHFVRNSVDQTKLADTIAQQIQRRIQIRQVKKSMVLNISYSHKDPALAQMVINALPQAYTDELRAMNTDLSNNSLQWMTSKIQEEKYSLEALEKKIQRFTQQHGFIAIEEKIALYPEKLIKFNNELSQAQGKEKELQAILRQAEQAKQKYQSIESIPFLAENSILQDLRSQIFLLEQEMRTLKKKYGPKHPIRVKTATEHEELLKKKDIEIERVIAVYKNKYELARTKVQDLQELLQTTKDELLALSKVFADYTTLNQEKKRNRKILDALLSNVKKNNITSESDDIQLWVLKKAELPNRPTSDNTIKKMGYGLLAGLFAGAILPFLFEALNNSPRNVSEFEKKYDIPVLGSVVKHRKKQGVVASLAESPLSSFAESYRMIQARLLLSRPDQPPKIILVTSMVQQEGKTTTTSNLAQTFANNGKKTLVIDCNMRRPRQHEVFNTANTDGISSYLTGNRKDWQELVIKVSTGAVHLLPSGPEPPNPTELFHSATMKTLLQEVQEYFDVVLLDSPPLQQVSDSLVLGTLVDGSIIVIKAGKTNYDMLNNGIRKIHEVNGHLLGVILNKVKEKTPYSYSGG